MSSKDNTVSTVHIKFLYFKYMNLVKKFVRRVISSLNIIEYCLKWFFNITGIVIHLFDQFNHEEMKCSWFGNLFNNISNPRMGHIDQFFEIGKCSTTCWRSIFIHFLKNLISVIQERISIPFNSRYWKFI